MRDLQRTAIDRDLPLPATVAVRIVLDAARATLKAHRLASELGLFPTNRLFLTEGVFVASFGGTLLTEVGVLAALVRCKQPRAIADLVAQLSPEELSTDLATQGSPEVFSLGVLLWELLTNRELFPRETEEQSRQAVQLQPIDPLNLVERCGMPVPQALAEVVRIATTRPSNQRYSSVERFVAALEALPAHFVATEHHVASALREQASELMQAFHVDPSKSSLTLGFSEVPASRMSTCPPPESTHNWDAPTFAQSRLVASAPILNQRSNADVNAKPAVGASPASAPRSFAANAVDRSDAPAPAVPAAGVFAASTRPFGVERSRVRRPRIGLVAALAMAAVVLVAAALPQTHSLAPARPETPPDRAVPRNAPQTPELQLSSALAPISRTTRAEPTSPNPMPISQPVATSRTAAAVQSPTASATSESVAPAARARSPRTPYRPRQIAPYHPKGI